MPEADPDETPNKLELSPVQVAASALAAVSAAVFASFFGTAGTLIGAALGSVVATVGSATYSYSLRRTAEVARRKAAQARETGGALRASLPKPRTSEPGAAGTARVAADEPADEAAEGAGAAPTSWWSRLDPRGKDLPWVRIGLASAAVLAVTLVVLTSFEGVTGRSVSDYTRGEQGSGTTVGNVFGGGSDSGDDGDDGTDEAPAPSPTSDPSPTDDAEPAEEPTEAPTQEPTETPDATDDPVPTPSPTLPTTPSPSTDPGAAGSGTGSGAGGNAGGTVDDTGTPDATPSS